MFAEVCANFNIGRIITNPILVNNEQEKHPCKKIYLKSFMTVSIVMFILTKYLYTNISNSNFRIHLQEFFTLEDGF